MALFRRRDAHPTERGLIITDTDTDSGHSLPMSHHAVGVYNTDAFLVRAVVDFARTAIEGHSMAAVILSSAQLAAVEHGLAIHGLDLTGYGAEMAEVLDAATERDVEIRIAGNLKSLLWETD